MTASSTHSDVATALEAHDGNGRPPVLPSLPATTVPMAEVGSGVPLRLDRSATLSGARLLVTDLRIAYLLANEARYRALERVFGVSRDQANLLTFMLLVLAADTVHDKVERALHGVGGPTRSDALLGTAAAIGLMDEIAGGPDQETSLSGPLVALALVGALSAPAVRRSMHRISSTSHRTLVAFRHRYGYLVAHGRRIARTRRLQARSGMAEPRPDSARNGEVASRIREVTL
jgi:hypothetical protein